MLLVSKCGLHVRHAKFTKHSCKAPWFFLHLELFSQFRQNSSEVSKKVADCVCWKNVSKNHYFSNQNKKFNSKILDKCSVKFWNLSAAKVCKSCRSRQKLSHEYAVAKIGVDTAENEPVEVPDYIEATLPALHAQGNTNVHLIIGPR